MRDRFSLAGLVVCLAVSATGCVSAYDSGQAALREGRNLEAASLLTQVVADDPTRADALLALGIAHYRAGFFGSAIGPLGRAVLTRPDLAEARLYLALAYLAVDDQGAAARQLKAVAELNVHPRTAAQARAAFRLMEAGVLPTAVREFVRESLEDGVAWQHEVLEARLAPHMYVGPAWFIEDPDGWRPLASPPYGIPRP